MSALRILGERLAREQDALLARHPPGATLDRTVRTKPKRTALLPALVGLVVLLGALFALAVFRTHPLDLTVGGQPSAPGNWISAPTGSSVPIRFSDGTEVTLEPDGRARVIEVTSSGAHLMLEAGTAQVSVTPNRSGHWKFSAGPFIVEVRGTRFEIGWSPREELFTLMLVEGKVTVSGSTLGDARSLFAGETLRASSRNRDFQIAPTAASSLFPANAKEPQEPPPPASGDSIVLPAPAAPSSRQSAVPSESWQSLARSNKFKEAFARVIEKGFDSELARADAQDLLLLGDVSRLSGNSAQALRAYQGVRSRAPGTESAANAAFSIGRVYFDQRDAYGDAARWFETYSNERGDGPLAREALGRQMEALSRIGDRAGAARVAEQYLRQYPKGPHAPLAKTLRTQAN